MAKLWPIWHPVVHAEYGETLRFLGLELENYPEALAFLKTLNLRVSVYEVYGDRDMIVRVYGPEAEIERVRREMQNHVGKMTSVFRTEDIFFIWGQEVPRAVNPLTPGAEIKTALSQFEPKDLESAASGWENLEEEERQKLIDSKLVIGSANDPIGREAIRAFIFIGSKLTTEENLLGIVNNIRQIDLVQEHLYGLYIGKQTGFGGDILVELSLPNEKFEDVIQLIRQIHDKLQLITPRTKTYIAGDITREHIDPCWFIETLDQTVSRWANRFQGMHSLELYDRLNIVHLCQHWNQWLNLPLIHPLAQSLIEATIDSKKNQDMQRLRNAVTAMGNVLETFLRRVFQRKAESKWEAEWQEKVKTDLAMGKPVSKWTLGDAIESFRRSKDRLDEEMVSVPDLRRLQEFSELRNAAAHTEREAGKVRFEEFSEGDIQKAAENAFLVMDKLREEMKET